MNPLVEVARLRDLLREHHLGFTRVADNSCPVCGEPLALRARCAPDDPENEILRLRALLAGHHINYTMGRGATCPTCRTALPASDEARDDALRFFRSSAGMS
jgi:hypothetical protein